MGGVNGEIDSPYRRQGLSANPQTPRHVRRKTNNRTISLRDQQDRRTEWAGHVLPAKELAGRNASDIARPLSKCSLQHFEDTGLVLRLEGPDFDPAVGGYGTRGHRERTIDQRWRGDDHPDRALGRLRLETQPSARSSAEVRANTSTRSPASKKRSASRRHLSQTSA